jgi:hypothetical protein
MSARWEGNTEPASDFARGGKPIMQPRWFRVFGLGQDVTQASLEALVGEVGRPSEVMLAHADGECQGFAWIRMGFDSDTAEAQRHLRANGLHITE